MSSDLVEVEHGQNKSTVTMSNPEKGNRLSQKMIDELTSGLRKAERHDSVAVVLTGEDGIFCAGGDISSFTNDSSEALNGQLFGDSDFRKVFRSIEELSKPVIAKVDGTALAGGFELALVSDFVVIGEEVETGTPEAKIGIAPGVAYVRLTEDISHHRAMEIMMTGKSFSGRETVEMGLFNKAVPVDEVSDVVDEYVRELSRVAPVALTVIKKIANRHRGGEDKVVSDLGLSVLLQTEDSREGFNAFLEGRKPDFEGK